MDPGLRRDDGELSGLPFLNVIAAEGGHPRQHAAIQKLRVE
jgi:hypothetical protein